jgi:hypothetical protein
LRVDFADKKMIITYGAGVLTGQTEGFLSIPKNVLFLFSILDAEN